MLRKVMQVVLQVEMEHWSERRSAQLETARLVIQALTLARRPRFLAALWERILRQQATRTRAGMLRPDLIR